VGHLQLTQIAQVCLGPTALGRVMITQAQEQGFKLLATATLVAHGIGPGPAQIANRFVACVRQVNSSQFASPVAAGQFDRIAAGWS
jgi:hypothetical protein